jgi:LDH2 family malate/lactate/ureidoglycolate dehydrogenase
MKRLKANKLVALATRAFEHMGARSEDAESVATALVRSNLCGYDSHGVFRLAQYYEWWKAGLLKPDARPVIAEETGVFAKVDGQRAFGQVAAMFATHVAIEKAQKSGVAVVTAHNSNHVGRLADYVEAIQMAGLIGFATVNDSGAGQCVVPWGGVDPRLSTNPIAMGIPGGAGGGILFDFSTSAAAQGKVRQLLLRGDAVPPGWLIDSTGKDTTDPATLFEKSPGAILPAGGHRGFALSLAVEVLAGILSGAGFSNPTPGPEEMNGVFVLALDVAWFQPLERFRAQVDQLAGYMKTSRPMPGVGPVHIPGEGSQREAARQAREGIAFSDQAWAKVAGVLRELGLADALPE